MDSSAFILIKSESTSRSFSSLLVTHNGFNYCWDKTDADQKGDTPMSSIDAINPQSR